MTDRLDTMAVGIQDESAKIARVILRPQSWRSVVATPTAHSQAIKFSHRSAVVRAKTQMHTLRGPDTVLRGDCEFHPKRPRRGSIVRSAVVSEMPSLLSVSARHGPEPLREAAIRWKAAGEQKWRQAIQLALESVGPPSAAKVHCRRFIA